MKIRSLSISSLFLGISIFGSIGTSFAKYPDFTAAIAFEDCSGSLVRFKNSGDDDRAMILTNGHCTAEARKSYIQPPLLSTGDKAIFLGSGSSDSDDYEVTELFSTERTLLDIPSNRKAILLASNGKSSLGAVQTERLIYATMTKTDLALYRLTQTYAEIRKDFGVEALTLSQNRPSSGDSFSIVTGYHLKIQTCAIDDFIFTLKEAYWTFEDSLRYTKSCHTESGWSGSPLVHTATNEVIGIHNTANLKGKKCTLDNPCEVDKNGTISVRKKAEYGQQTYLLYGCLNAAGTEFDPNNPACKLPLDKI